MLLIDKPKGISSFRLVQIVRRVTGIKKVGHAGTLDPLASGLMIILVGREETKQADKFLKLDKAYQTTILLGESRTTGDMEGEIVNHVTIPNISQETIKKTLNSMVGDLALKVPIFSAIKQNGKRLYKIARKGHISKEVLNNVPRKIMTIKDIDLLNVRRVTKLIKNVPYDMYEVNVIFYVKSGVYIRSLSEEFGKRLNLPATTKELRRIQIDKYSIKNAQKVDEIESGKLNNIER
jgi:tRNA pseudouridine55 synthase